VTSRKGVTECARAAGARWSRRGPVNFNGDVEVVLEQDVELAGHFELEEHVKASELQR
jgi:hypothetical protein